MTEYTQGVCSDGAAILKDGVAISIEEILAELREMKGDATEAFYIKVSNKERLQMATKILDELHLGDGNEYGIEVNDIAPVLNGLDKALIKCRQSCRTDMDAKG